MFCNMPGNTPERICCCQWLWYPAALSKGRVLGHGCPEGPRDPSQPCQPAQTQQSPEAGCDLPNPGTRGDAPTPEGRSYLQEHPSSPLLAMRPE